MSNIKDRKEQVQEILKCGKDATYFINKYVKIQHPIKGVIDFKTYSFQNDCIDAFEKNRFNIILKSRQLGLSTVTAAYCVWYSIFYKDKNILVIATKLDTAINFIKKVKVMLQSLPPWLLLTKFEETKRSIRFNNGSTITAIPTSEDAGRSEALSLLIVDEAAFIRDFDDIWTGLVPTLATGGKAILISTPNGVGGQYYRLWVDAESGLNDFNAIKLPWHVHPDHNQEWFDKETKNLAKRKISQEFLCDFISSGDTFLQADELEYLKNMIKPPLERQGFDRNVWIWKHPDKESKYVLSADVARGDSKDYSTFHILNEKTCEIVAEYKGKVPPDKFADLIAEFGKKYNNALVCPENNTFGYMTATHLKQLNYPNLYYAENKYVYDIGSDSLPGFTTHSKNRVQILAKLEETLRNKTLISSSQRLYHELQNFMWNGNRASASKDSNDDLIMSLAIGVWIIDTTYITRDLETSKRDLLTSIIVSKQELAIPINPIVSSNSKSPYKNSVYNLFDFNSRTIDDSDMTWLIKK